MKFIFPMFLLCCFEMTTSMAQGTNNDFDYDQEDLNLLFEELGYSVFKFPVRQERNEILDVVVEEYRNGELSDTRTVISQAKAQFEPLGVDILRYARPKMDSTQTDSVYLSRFYFHKSDTSLTVKVVTQGLTVPLEFEAKDLYLGSVRARFETKTQIEETGHLSVDGAENLIFFYGNLEEDKTLWCPAGLPKKQIIKLFDYAVFVSFVDYEEAQD